MKAFLSTIHPTAQKIAAAILAVTGVLVAFNTLTPSQATAVSTLITALAAFFDPIRPVVSAGSLLDSTQVMPRP